MRGRAFGIGGVLAAVAVIGGCGGGSEQGTSFPSDAATPTLAQTSGFSQVGVCDTRTRRPDSIVLANELLSQARTDRLIPREQLDALSKEIADALSVVRSARPATEGIHPQPDYVPGEIVVGLDPPLLDALRQAQSAGVTTGYAQFDKLSASLGLTGWQTSGYDSYALLCFGDQINAKAGAEAYKEVSGIRSAEVDQYTSIPELIPNDIEAAKDGDSWYLVFRKGADFSMATNPVEVYFFMVSGDTFTDIPPSRAAADPIFARLAERCARVPCRSN